MIEIDDAADKLFFTAARFLNEQIAFLQLSRFDLLWLDGTDRQVVWRNGEFIPIKVGHPQTNNVIDAVRLFAPYAICTV